jgi:malate dehydrogenase (oxaloacetate-decarboxylating)
MNEISSRKKGKSVYEKALCVHARYHGKVQCMPKCPITRTEDFALYYTPGVAEPCRAIETQPDLVYEYTNKGNSIAIVTDGSRVLGLGDIGPEAGLPVMEGKAMLFKYLGGVDAVPVCLSTHDPSKIIETVKLLQPTFGGINLEDIEQPKCFAILDALRESMHIPVWHDDQQGTATATLAGLINALKVVGKDMKNIRIVLFGMGAANIAVYRTLMSLGVSSKAITACDEFGLLHRGRSDIEEKQDEFYDLWQICQSTNPDNLTGNPGKAFEGADVCIAFSASGPDIISPDWIRRMAPDSILFACANPVPEIWPEKAIAAGARIVATGRSDFDNQLNNSLVFPGLFRGVLDSGASTVTDEMVFAAANALAGYAEAKGLSNRYILPTMGDWKLAAAVATATAMKAQEQGIARTMHSRDEYHHMVTKFIGDVRQGVDRMFKAETSGETSDEYLVGEETAA